MILGTAAYMCPSRRGQALDKRTDIWAFGCVLYEMLTGRARSTARTCSDTLAAVLSGEPDWDALPQPTPARIGALIKRCLEKNHRGLYSEIAVVRFMLGEAFAAALPPPAITATSRRRSAMALESRDGAFCTDNARRIGRMAPGAISPLQKLNGASLCVSPRNSRRRSGKPGRLAYTQRHFVAGWPQARVYLQGGMVGERCCGCARSIR